MSELETALQNLKTYYLISGIANALAFLIGTFAVVIFGIVTFGCGCVFIVLPFINAVVMVFDFVAFSRVAQPPDPAAYSLLRAASILDVVAGFVVVPLVMGLLNLQILARPEVYARFHPPGGSGAGASA